MNNLIARLKVTSAKTTPGPKAPIAAIKKNNVPAPQHKASKMPLPTSIRVATPTVAKPKFVPNTKGREAELLKAATAVKNAEANAVTEKKFNDTMLENLRKEYAEYVKKLMAQMEETGPLYFAVKDEPKAEAPKTAEPKVESPKKEEPTVETPTLAEPVAVDNTVPQPLGNFGEIEPAPKKSHKKKAEA